MKKKWFFKHEQILGRPIWRGPYLGLSASKGVSFILNIDNGEVVKKVKIDTDSKPLQEFASEEFFFGTEIGGRGLFRVNVSEKDSEIETLDSELSCIDFFSKAPGHNGCILSGCNTRNHRVLSRIDENGKLKWTTETLLQEFRRFRRHFVSVENLIWQGFGNSVLAVNCDSGETRWKLKIDSDLWITSIYSCLNRVWLKCKDNKVVILNSSSGLIESTLLFEGNPITSIVENDQESVLLSHIYGFYPYRLSDGHVPYEIDFLERQKKTGRDAGIHAPPLRVGDKIYVGSHDCHLYCFDAHTGEEVEKWRFDDFVHEVHLAPNGFLHVQVMDGSWHAFSDYPC